MKKVTAKELMDDQRKRYIRLKQKEQVNSTTADARANFRRVPYMGMYRRQNRRGNDPEGRG